jgi:hypothetical protein
MALRDLTLGDAARLFLVLRSMARKGDTLPDLDKVAGAIRDEDAAFRNPPSPTMADLQAWAAKLRAGVANHYGEDYASDLWERIKR